MNKRKKAALTKLIWPEGCPTVTDAVRQEGAKPMTHDSDHDEAVNAITMYLRTVSPDYDKHPDQTRRFVAFAVEQRASNHYDRKPATWLDAVKRDTLTALGM